MSADVGPYLVPIACFVAGVAAGVATTVIALVHWLSRR